MAKEFSYRFETILNIKEKDEENKKILLGNATKALNKEREHLQLLLEKKTSLQQQWRSLGEIRTTIKDIKTFSNTIKYFEDLIKSQSNTVKNCEAKVNGCRLQLVDARKQTKIYSKIKEKDRSLYQYKLAKDEEVLVDELISYNTVKKQGG
ncbi:flagellar export protein FliJ [Alkaliphilus serpentinus]|uniref:Flagellar FliJ protein n=1 Tax=Alkaliphilus serpentinus TaxID=1482731 RepID=A0A833MA22_9FIRM|nr:flagellar export protein FliJ [Alkaliphilus serpentinus]KAB3531385.1 flagellar export protein FliJ [Alkaliphilus serpentinus]